MIEVLELQRHRPRQSTLQEAEFGQFLDISLVAELRESTFENESAQGRLLVISGGGWSWLLSLVQVGHHPKGIDAWGITEEGKRNLEELTTVQSLPLSDVARCADIDPTKAWCWKLMILENVEGTLGDSRVVRLLRTKATRWIWSGSRAGSRRVKTICGRDRQIHTRALTHAQLGGITKARTTVLWSEDEGNVVNIGQVKHPPRPMGDWIKLAAKLEFGKASQPVWSAADKSMFPWPLPARSSAIAVPSVFFPNGDLVTRSIAASEQAQFLDLPCHWEAKSLNAIWAWNRGAVLPLKIPVEFLLAARPWYDTAALLKAQRRMTAPEERTKQHTTTQLFGGMKAIAEKGNEVSLTKRFDVTQDGWLWEPGLGNEVSVATKSDNEGVDTSQWGVGGPDKEDARQKIRKWLLALWKRGVTREAVDHLQKFEGRCNTHASTSLETKPDLTYRNAIRECVTRSANATWWEWSDGSSLFFWRWPKQWQEEALRGSKAFHTAKPPKRLQARVVPIESQEHADLLVSKIRKLLVRRYVRVAEESEVWCVIPFFVVPKGEFDIRVVWSDTENGVNPSIVAPTFFMPLPDTLFRRTPAGAFIGDIDVGEMFHNFPLHQSERAYAGIRLTPEQAEALGVSKTLFVWDRLLFGWRPSPYFSVKMMTRAVEVAKGDRNDPNNPFAWDSIRFNLPGQPDYDPGEPWLIKWRTWDGHTACEVVFFVDDGRIIGPTEELTTKATRQVAAGIQWLGIQDASRKRRPVSQRPGAWAGTVVFTDCGIPRKFLAQKKWDKAKTIVKWLRTKINAGVGLPYKELLSYRGFLVHVSLTYTFIKPYLKGLHLTAESWRPKYQNPSLDGWPDQKFENQEAYNAALVDDTEEQVGGSDNPEGSAMFESGGERDINTPNDDTPLIPVPRLTHDVGALESLFGTVKPAMIPLRPVSGRVNLAYGFVDASGHGFGGTWRDVVGEDGATTAIGARHGFWCSDVSEESSNYREFRNLVEHVEAKAKTGALLGKEVWLFTDNMVTELVVFTGTSKAITLFELVLRLRLLERDGQFTLRVVHVAGTRMIHEGTDGLSRGQVDVSQLTDLVASQVPLHLSALQRVQSRISPWLDEWVGQGDWRLASPDDWFDAAQTNVMDPDTNLPRTWVWDIPPAAGEHVLEELALARLRRHSEMRGIVLIPGLMRPYWFRRFSRTVDAYFVVPVGSQCWPESMHEPLIVGLFFPLLRYRPWDWKRAPALVAGVRKVQAMYKEDSVRGRDLLRELWLSCLWIQGMPERLVSKLLSNGHVGPLLGVASKRRADRRVG